jgi:hypothetical protein
MHGGVTGKAGDSLPMSIHVHFINRGATNEGAATEGRPYRISFECYRSSRNKPIELLHVCPIRRWNQQSVEYGSKIELLDNPVGSNKTCQQFVPA